LLRPPGSYRRIAQGERVRREDVVEEERTGEHWLEWLAGELDRRGGTPERRLLVLWDVLEEWFASEDFDGSFLAGAAPPLHDAADPAHRVMSQQRRSLRHLLEELASSAGVHDPARLASQLQVLYEGAVVGALIDRQPGVARIARYLTRVALSADGRR
jgi:hypothetical protein